MLYIYVPCRTADGSPRNQESTTCKPSSYVHGTVNKTDKTKGSVRTKASMYNMFMARWQANPVPLASSILNCGTAQTVTPWRQTGLRWDLWEQFVGQSMEAWVMLNVLTYQRLEAAVTEAEADAPTTPATHTISMMGGTALIPGQLVHDL